MTVPKVVLRTNLQEDEIIEISRICLVDQTQNKVFYHEVQKDMRIIPDIQEIFQSTEYYTMSLKKNLQLKSRRENQNVYSLGEKPIGERILWSTKGQKWLNFLIRNVIIMREKEYIYNIKIQQNIKNLDSKNYKDFFLKYTDEDQYEYTETMQKVIKRQKRDNAVCISWKNLVKEFDGIELFSDLKQQVKQDAKLYQICQYWHIPSIAIWNLDTNKTTVQKVGHYYKNKETLMIYKY